MAPTVREVHMEQATGKELARGHGSRGGHNHASRGAVGRKKVAAPTEEVTRKEDRAYVGLLR